MPFKGDPLAFVGKRILEEHHAVLLKKLPPIRPDVNDSTPFDIDVSDDQLRFLPSLKVGIVGAGAGGLYTALMLDSLGIEYEIIESSGRVGGRLQTFKFEKGKKYDYYEAGAMRFPLPKKAQGEYKNGTMKRLAELIEYGPLNEGDDRLKDKLIPYYYNAREGSNPGFYYYNGIFESVSSKPKGPFNAEGMNVKADYIKAGADAITNDVLNPFIRMLINDLLVPGEQQGWDTLKANDTYSARAYMASKYMPSDNLQLAPQHLPSDVINWCQLLKNFAGGYDRALTEAVFEALAFAQVGDNDYGDVDWKCLDGGSETLPKRIEKYINSTGVSVQFNKRVTALGQGVMVVSVPIDMINEDTLPSGVQKTDSDSVDYHVTGEDKTTDSALRRIILKVPCVEVKVNVTEVKKYSHVISSLPLPVLRTVDLTNAGLNIMQKNALRALDYGPAVKIAVLFKSNWWTTKLGIVGGQSFTDLPIQTIVYPSYGVDSDTPSKVLIASYAWTEDAFRLSALSSEKEREVLKELVLRNLAEAHGHLSREITYDYLKSEFVDLNIKDWNRDEHTMGAFAFFSPGKFEDLYASLNVPAAENRLHFVGEAISTRHAWVVGALDSAWKAVFQYLKITGQVDKIAKFKEIWGENVEWTGSSNLLQRAGYDGDAPDLLDQHLGLVNKAVQGGIIAQRN